MILSRKNALFSEKILGRFGVPFGTACGGLILRFCRKNDILNIYILFRGFFRKSFCCLGLKPPRSFKALERRSWDAPQNCCGRVARKSHLRNSTGRTGGPGSLFQSSREFLVLGNVYAPVALPERCRICFGPQTPRALEFSRNWLGFVVLWQRSPSRKTESSAPSDCKPPVRAGALERYCSRMGRSPAWNKGKGNTF